MHSNLRLENDRAQESAHGGGGLAVLGSTYSDDRKQNKKKTLSLTEHWALKQLHEK